MTPGQFGHHPELPELQAGVTLLDVDDELGVEPLHTLVIDRLLTTEGPAHWVDAEGHARTTTLRELAPHRGYLERINVARAFTPYQHAALVDRLVRFVEADGTPPALIVAAGFDALYRADDLPRGQAEQFIVRRIAMLAGLAREYDVPVLITRTKADEFTEPLENGAHFQQVCENTRFGPRFSSPDNERETMVYSLGNGWVQTTIAFWREVLEHRARRSDVVTPEVAPATPSTPEF